MRPRSSCCFSAWLLQLVCLCLVAVAVRSGMYKPNRCYSCMSEWYEQFFRNGALNSVFYEPKNFTRYCDEPARPDRLDVVACRTICLTVQQEVVMMGHRTGQVVTMRGCAISLARRGIYNHTLALFDRYDICKEMNAADLFRAEGGRGESQRIRVCSCLGDRCNGALSASATNSTLLLLFLTLITVAGLR